MEAIKCPNCGSEKVKELTEEKYVCLGCDNIFLVHNLSKEFRQTDEHIADVHGDELGLAVGELDGAEGQHLVPEGNGLGIFVAFLHLLEQVCVQGFHDLALLDPLQSHGQVGGEHGSGIHTDLGIVGSHHIDDLVHELSNVLTDDAAHFQDVDSGFQHNGLLDYGKTLADPLAFRREAHLPGDAAEYTIQCTKVCTLVC